MGKKNLSISVNCVSEKLDDELVILNLNTGNYHQLTKTGIFIWDTVLAEQITLEQLIIKAENQFQGESIRNDIFAFVKTLLEKDIFVES